MKDEKSAKTYELKVPVVFEDDYLAIVNKPAGLTTSGNSFKTLENTLAFNLEPGNQPDAYQQPKPIHRLDHATSGLVIVAKTKAVRVALGKALQEGQISKFYKAIVSGDTPSHGEIHTPIEGQKAHTTYKKVKSRSDKLYTLLELSPITGRTHQLRIHCAEEGFPIVGDKLYGGVIGPGKGLFLCAYRIGFQHPVTGAAIDAHIDLPQKFNRLLKD
nr:RluA family pseudouridine synthase [Fulvivirga aurantia]